ncbi:MAG: hypothetical protein IJL19_08025 [Clostridiales bacterium]|nr:hypothetical protein [Clostridiales bacterium]
MKRISLVLAAAILLTFLSAGLTSCKKSAKETGDSQDVSEDTKESSDYSGDGYSPLDLEEITFGSYGGQDIVWLVLDSTDNGVLVLSKYVIDYGTFDGDDVMRSWESTRLQPWLNEDFYEQAFTDEEKEKILWTEIAINDHLTDYVSGYPTEDMYRDPALNRVFLMSMEELDYYSDKLTTCYCEATDYAVSQGADKIDCDWWVRGPCEIQRTSDGTDTGKPYLNSKSDPSNGKFELMFTDDPSGIRPAMWIDYFDIVKDRVEPSDWIAEVSVETSSHDGLYTYTLYSGSDYEMTLEMDVNIDDYINGNVFDLPKLLKDYGWEFYDSDANPTDDIKEISTAVKNGNGHQTQFGFFGVNSQNDQFTDFYFEYHMLPKAGESIFDAESYYPRDYPGRDGNYEIYEPLVGFDDHKIEYLVNGFGYDYWGDLTYGLSYSDIVILVYGIRFASDEANFGKNPYYYTSMKGSESIMWSMCYDLP